MQPKMINENLPNKFVQKDWLFWLWDVAKKKLKKNKTNIKRKHLTAKAKKQKALDKSQHNFKTNLNYKIIRHWQYHEQKRN